MGIHNGVGFSSYQRTMDQRIAGTIASSRTPLMRPFINPLAQQVSRFTVGGAAADGLYRITVVEPDGTTHNVDFDRSGGESNDQIGDGLQAAMDALTSLRGVVESTEDTGADIFDATFEHEGIQYTFATSSPAGATLVATEQTSPAGTAIPLARFVSDGGVGADGQRRAALPDGVAATAIRGILIRPMGVFVNAESELSTANDEAPAGSMLDVAFDGEVNMANVGGAAAQGGSVFVVVDTGSGDQLGEARGDVSGVAGLFTCTPVVVNDTVYGLEIVWRGTTHTRSILSDGTATATEICDAFRTAFGTIAGLTLGGTTTLTVAGAAGEALSVVDVGPGDMGVVETTPAEVHAVELPGAYWAEDVAANAVGPIMMRL